MAKTLVFLLSGKAGVGKTHSYSIASDITKKLGMVSCYSPFATGVKNTARFMGWDGRKDIAGRRLLQRIGSAGREYDIDLWAKKSINFVQSQIGYPFDIVFIDDWRFKNEHTYLLSQPLYKPILIRIDAPLMESLKGTPEYDDVSETELDGYTFDYVISNSLNTDLEPILDSIIKQEVSKNIW